MPDKKIKIEGIDHGTGKLKLSDHGWTEVDSKWKHRKITWKIDCDDVKSFKIVGKTTYNPFEEPIPVNYETEVKLKVIKDEPRRDWDYSIYWKDALGNITISDPIISIRPSRLHHKILKYILFLLVPVLGLFTLNFLGRKKRGG